MLHIILVKSIIILLLMIIVNVKKIVTGCITVIGKERLIAKLSSNFSLVPAFTFTEIVLRKA